MKKGTFYQKGVTKLERGVQFVFRIEKPAKEVQIVFLAGEKEIERILVPEWCRQGQLYSVILDELPSGADAYCYYADKKRIRDFYAKALSGLKAYGREKAEVYSLLPAEEYDWEGDVRRMRSYETSVFYGLHVRGFTKHSSSGVKKKGTFAGIREKIPYFTELGITAVELMPAYEFDEVEKQPENYQSRQAESRVNYWGFKEGWYYAPKSAYAYGSDAVQEMKDMIKALHKAGIEVILQFYFPRSVNCSEIPEILRFWTEEYHADGFHLMGENLPAELIAADPLLKETKLILNQSLPKTEDLHEERKEKKHTALWRYDFTYDIRKALKGDEGCLSALMFHLQDNPDEMGALHAAAGYDGFTLNDLVSYDRKHNEANGEENKDGTDYNCSWNCGIEGKTRKRTIQLLRRRQMKNALAFVMLSQGTPYLQSGDEFCRTQGGNNNPYCQDNEVTWIDWRMQKLHKDFYEYTKKLIAFRREHAVFHRKERLKGLDYLGYGCPDISFHGEEAWKPNFEGYSRHAGVLYAGCYAADAEGEADADFYLAVNMHWEPHTFALPKLPKEKKWELCIDTALPESFYQKEETGSEERYTSEEELMVSDGQITLMERSVAVCRSVKRKTKPSDKKKKPEQEKEKTKTEKPEAERAKTEKAEKEKPEAERAKTEKAEKEKPEAERAEKEKIKTENPETKTLETERPEAEK